MKDKKNTANGAAGTVLEMEKPTGSEPVPAPSAAVPAKNVGGRGNKKDGPNFWDRLRSINTEDWATRYFLYLYRLEPLIDRLRSGEKKYVMRYSESVDEEKILVEQGSGRYRLNLVCLKPTSASEGSEIASHEFDLLNEKYPPKIPKGEWIDDPRNKKWAWAREPEPPAVPAQPLASSADPAATFVKAMEVSAGIRKEVREETNAGGTDIDKFSQMVTVVKGILPAPPPATDNTMLNTVVTLLQSQIAASNLEAQQLRQQVFTMIQKQSENSGEKKDAVSLFDEFINKAETLLPKIKGLLNVATEGATNVVHGRPRPWWQDVAAQSLPQIAPAVGTVMQTLVSRFLAPAPGSVQFAPNPGMNGAPVNGAAQIAAQPNEMQAAGSRLMNFLMFNARPLQRYFEDFLAGKEIEGIKAGGDDFAAWVVESYGDGVLKDARMLGTGNIMALFKSSALWPHVQQHEVRMVDFLNQFIAFQPEPEEDDGAPENENVLDLTTQEAI